MGKQPSFQFYPGDWLKDPALSSVSHAARGVWIDLICLMFESEERGVLTNNGLAWSLDKTAHALRGDSGPCLLALTELIEAGVLRRRDTDGAFYSARVVRDERLRKARAKAGRAGGIASHKDASKTASKPQAKRKQKGGSSSSSSSSKQKEESASADSRDPCGSHDGDNHRLRCPIWDAVSAIWYPSGVPTGRRSHVGRIVADLKQLGATAETIQQRAETHRKLWPTMTCTAQSVLNHWDQLDGTNRSGGTVRKGQEPGRVRNSEADKYDSRIRRTGTSEGPTT